MKINEHKYQDKRKVNRDAYTTMKKAVYNEAALVLNIQLYRAAIRLSWRELN